MSPGVQWGGSLLFVVAITCGFVSAMFVHHWYDDLVALVLTSIVAWYLTIKMNWLCRNPGVKYKLEILGIGEMLRLSDRHHLFWLYLSSALLFSLGALYGIFSLHFE